MLGGTEVEDSCGTSAAAVDHHPVRRWVTGDSTHSCRVFARLHCADKQAPPPAKFLTTHCLTDQKIYLVLFLH